MGARSRSDGGRARPSRRADRRARRGARRALAEVDGRGRLDGLGVRLGTGGARRRPWPPRTRSRTRPGRAACRSPCASRIHTGEAQRRDGDYFGPTVNLAARVRGQADGGQIFLSTTTRDLVAARLPAGCELVDLGPHRLKGVGAPEQVHAVRGPGLTTPLPGRRVPVPRPAGVRARGPRSSSSGARTSSPTSLGRLAPGPAARGRRRVGQRQVLGPARRRRRRGPRGRGRRDRRRDDHHPGRRPAARRPGRRPPSSSSSTSSRSSSRCATTASAARRFIDALLALRGPGRDRACAPTSTGS